MKLNFPNFLILIRLLFVPLIVILLLVPSIINVDMIVINSHFSIYRTDIIAGIFFIVASITDFVDGWYARNYNQITTFGKLFDPLADKILVNSTLIIFGARGIIPILFVIVFIIRDVLVDGLRMMLASNDVILSANLWGKLKTIFQMIGLTILFFIHSDVNGDFFKIYDWGNLREIWTILILFVALIFSIYSGINYYINGLKKINLKE